MLLPLYVYLLTRPYCRPGNAQYVCQYEDKLSASQKFSYFISESGYQRSFLQWAWSLVVFMCVSWPFLGWLTQTILMAADYKGSFPLIWGWNEVSNDRYCRNDIDIIICRNVYGLVGLFLSGTWWMTVNNHRQQYHPCSS